MTADAINSEAAEILAWLRETRTPVSPLDLLDRFGKNGHSALGVRAAFLSLVDRGQARYTADSRIEATNE
jgi:hypothetical protein